jgi:hypothetical protein
MDTGDDTHGRIARIWRGRVPRDRADAYLDLMERTALPAYRATHPEIEGRWRCGATRAT